MAVSRSPATSSRSDGRITDVPGVRVGHATARRRGWRTGTTVVLLASRPGEGATTGVDVRGGGPGTRETDVLHPGNLVHHAHAICLTGGSAYGLASADGVMRELEARGIGFPVATTTVPGVVPIVPTAEAVALAVFEMPLRLSDRVSSFSNLVSPRTATLTRAWVTPGAKVTLPVAAE